MLCCKAFTLSVISVIFASSSFINLLYLAVILSRSRLFDSSSSHAFISVFIFSIFFWMFSIFSLALSYLRSERSFAFSSDLIFDLIDFLNSISCDNCAFRLSSSSSRLSLFSWKSCIAVVCCDSTSCRSSWAHIRIFLRSSIVNFSRSSSFVRLVYAGT